MIEEDHGRRAMRAMREALAVSLGAHYAWRARPETEKAQSDRRLLVGIGRSTVRVVRRTARFAFTPSFALVASRAERTGLPV